MDELAIRELIRGVLECDNHTKAKLGQLVASHLRLTPGKPGADGGVDGSGTSGDRSVVFQSKLQSEKIGAEKADEFFGILLRNEADIGIYFAGEGFTRGFIERLDELCQSKRVTMAPEVYLLTLRDVVTKSPRLKKAIQGLPQLDGVQRVLFGDPSGD